METTTVVTLANRLHADAPNRTGYESVSFEQFQAVRTYIKQTWETLRRGHDHILTAARDSKVEHESGQSWPVYISQKEDMAAVAETLKQSIPEEFDRIRLTRLPDDPAEIEDHGLLYLPGDYVVPGGRFNELYGWDSYFILLGLLEDGEMALAKSLTEQLLYQVEHYGTVLNANRTYFLERSQPPLLAAMVLKLYEYTEDYHWLEETLPTLEKYYQYWLRSQNLDEKSGLSRFWAGGDGPAPEVEVSECDEDGRSHFERIKEYYRTHQIDDYDVSLFYNAETDELTDLFYRGDRTMRESGFDPTNRFGPFSVDIVHYLPVCLNSLLYKMERDMAEVYRQLLRVSYRECSHQQKQAWKAQIRQWEGRAKERQRSIDEHLWDQESGLYLDYHINQESRRYYEFATTFYPLWVGVASEQQAAAVVANLDKFEAVGGVRTSTHSSGNQWDAPFGWAPLQLIAIEGLYRYGYIDEAVRLAQRFISLIVKDFERSGSLLEKYDIETCTGEVSDGIDFGYSSNEIGFGWTNGVVLTLLTLLNAHTTGMPLPLPAHLHAHEMAWAS